jgi:glycosyltransferase involved in cell wall biosynthesis
MWRSKPRVDASQVGSVGKASVGKFEVEGFSLRQDNIAACKMTRPRISVAMCTFDGARYLVSQLDSIATQTRPPDELVICDDGSSDGTLEILSAFVKKARFFTRVFINSKNLGSTANFEKSISRCHGEIIVLADQDDVWYPSKLERIDEVFAQSGHVVAAFSDADLIDETSASLGQRLWPTFSFDASRQRQFGNGGAFHVLLRQPVVTGAAMAFRRNLFEMLTPFPRGQIHDRWMSFFLALRGSFAVISDPLMQYRVHTSQQIGTGARTWSERIDCVKNTGVDFYRTELNTYRLVRERLRSRSTDFPGVDRQLAELDQKIAHLAHRTELPPAKMARIPEIVRESVNRNYWRYSGGWRSIAKDLVLR